MSVVGIDLGTTNTVIASVIAGPGSGGKVHVLSDEHGQRLLPSVVSFHPNGEVLVGAAARARRVIDPRNTIYSHKRLLGRSWGSPEIGEARQRFAFELREGPGQGPLVRARQKDYTLPEISAFVLKRARQIAEAALGSPVDRAVITVPAHFNELQRASTKVAGRVSGLEVLRILNEPTAAALAYGLGRSGNERVAVYDFGGGTFDCTLLDLNGNVFEVLATAGDSFLGGDDVDAVIAQRMAEQLLRQHRIDATNDVTMMERLRAAAESVKIALATAEHHTAVLDDVAHGPGGSSVQLAFTMTHRDLEAVVQPFVDRTFRVTEDALALARLAPSSFDKVILVGGSTRIPSVRARVEAFFGSPPLDRVNPDEVVAIGAAIQAASLSDGTRRRSIPAPPPVPTSAARVDTTTRPGLGMKRPALPSEPTSPPSTAHAPATRPVAPPEVARTQPMPQRPTPGGMGKTQPMAQRPMPAPPPSAPPPSARPPMGTVTAVMPAQTLAPMARAAQPSRPGASPTEPPTYGSNIPPAAYASGPPHAPSPTPGRPLSAPPGAPGSARPAHPNHPLSHLPALGTHGAIGLDPRGAPAPRPPILVDVTPRALVVETAGGFTDTVIPRNAKIPCERTRRFSTSSDNQTVVRVRVAQGEEPRFADNTYLGEVALEHLPPGPRFTVVVAVTFEVDADGSLRVKARDVTRGNEARATLQLVGVADEDAVAVMAARFDQHAVVGGGPVDPHGRR